MKKVVLLLLLAVAASTVSAAEPRTAEGVLACMQANVPETLRVQDLELDTSDRSGISVARLRGRLYMQREPGAEPAGQKLIRAMLRIDAPATFAGAAYLVRQNDEYMRDGMYVYLPSIKRVRRVSGVFADGPLLGTNFSYSDFRQLQNSFGGAAATLEESAVVDKHDVFVLGFTPAKGDESVYGRLRVWVEKESCQPLKMEVYENSTVRKRLTVPYKAIRKSGSTWYVSLAEMEDLKEGTKTTLRVLQVATDQPLPSGYFNPETFWK